MEKEEIWVKVKYTNGKYFVSNRGRFKKKVNGEFIEVKPYLNKGYLRVNIGYPKQAKRIVVEHFLPNYKNKNFVLHKDGDKLNIDVDNLYWHNDSRGRVKKRKKIDKRKDKRYGFEILSPEKEYYYTSKGTWMKSKERESYQKHKNYD